MKKNVKHFKRWLALFLAVVVVATTCMYAPDHFLRATDGSAGTEAEEVELEFAEEELVISKEEGETGIPDKSETDPEEDSEEGPEAEETEPTEEVSEENKEKLPEASPEETEEDSDEEELPKAGREEIEEEAVVKTDENETDKEEPAEQEDLEAGADEKESTDPDSDGSEEDKEKIENEEGQTKETVPVEDVKNTQADSDMEYLSLAAADEETGDSGRHGETGAWVYVYVRLDGMGDDTDTSESDPALDKKLKELGLTVNEHGWCTIGRTWTPELSKAEKEVWGDPEQLEAAKSALDNIEFKNEEINKDVLNQVTGWTLHGVGTADGYEEDGVTWHLDGILDLTKAGYTVTCHYSDDGSWESEHIRKETGYGISGSDIPYDMDQNRSYNGKTYAPDHKKTKGGIVFGASEGKVSAAAEDNTVDIYYALDENGPDQTSDGIPDYQEYRVTYEGNEGLDKMGIPDYMDSHIYPAEYHPVYAGPNQFGKENAEFAGWKMSDDAAGKLIKEGQTFAMPDHDVILVAQWRELSVNKTAQLTDADGKPRIYRIGDTIEFSIDVTNTGDVSLEHIKVTDMLAGAVLEAGEGYTICEDGTAMITNLAAGERVTVKATCEVTEDQIGRTDFVNRVKVEAGELKAEAATGPLPMEDKISDFSITKRIVDEKDEYAVGDVIEYAITVTNTGNVKLDHIVVTDLLSIEGRQVSFDNRKMPGGITVDGNRATITELPVDMAVTLNCSYEVTREDAMSDVPLRNSVIATGTAGANGPVIGPKGDTTPEVKLPDVYNLTIHYVSASGETLADDVVAQYLAGETFSYLSPQIEGYTPNYAFVRTEAAGMPRADVEVSVIYTANPGPVPPIPGGTTTPGSTTPGGTTPGGTAPGGAASGGTASGGAGSRGGGTAAPAAGTDTLAAAPAEGTAAGAGTAAAATEETQASDETVPQGAAITTDEEGNVQIVPVTDPEVPLANLGDAPDGHEHECCALHFILLLTSMIVLGLYTRDRKKLQKRVFGLTEELEAEKQKRAR